MTKLAIIDLDGVVANVDARFVKAEEAKQVFLAACRAEPIVIDEDRPARAKEATDIYWRTVFNPENVPLDTLIDGTKEALQTLRFEQHYKFFLLTSRPESMRLATVEWLFNQNILFYAENGNVALIMKPPAFQFTKTVVWKAGTIQMLVALYGAGDVLVVDDEPANLSELMKYDTSHMRLCTSLAEAVTPAPEPDVNLDERPF